MNWRRGLFRLWIVGAALFVIAVASISYTDIKAEFDAVASKPEAGPSIFAAFRKRYPQYNDLSNAQLADALYKKFYSDMPRHQFDAKIASIQLIEFERQLYKFPADATDAEIAAALKSKQPLTPVTDPKLIEQLEAAPSPRGLIPDPFTPSPWARVGMVAAFAFGIPLVVLILGASLVWAFSGFATTRS